MRTDALYSGSRCSAGVSSRTGSSLRRQLICLRVCAGRQVRGEGGAAGAAALCGSSWASGLIAQVPRSPYWCKVVRAEGLGKGNALRCSLAGSMLDTSKRLVQGHRQYSMLKKRIMAGRSQKSLATGLNSYLGE